MPPLTSEAQGKDTQDGGTGGKTCQRGRALTCEEARRQERGTPGSARPPATMCELYSKQDTLALRRKHIG